MHVQTHSAWSRMVDCLYREDRLLSGLCATAEEQMVALSENDLKAIDTAVGRMNQLFAGISAIEEERRNIQETLDIEFGLDPNGALSKLIPHADAENGPKMDVLLKTMRSKAERLREVNQINAIMTKRALTFNRLILNSLVPEETVTYGAAGEVGPGGRNNGMINKTV